jgi:hypothetical protein
MQYKRGEHPNSLKNLEKGKFKKGEISNPRGRPPNELSLTNLTRETLDQVCPYDTKGRTWKEYLVDRWLALSAENPSYFRELVERLEGKVTQPIEAGIDTDIHFVIGKGYVTDKPDMQLSEGEKTLPIENPANVSNDD